MKTFNIILCCFFYFIFSVSMEAQEVVCGTADLELIKERLIQNRSSMQGFARPRSIEYVAIKFHLIAQNDGSGRIPEFQVLDMLCILNEAYADQEIQFYMKDGTFGYVDNSDLYLNPNNQVSSLKSLRVNNAINIFIVKNAGGENVAGYYQNPSGWSGNDFIVVAKAFVYGQNVLPHEVGHFFALLHPFHGWEPCPWDGENPAPSSTCIQIEVECQNMTNGDNAGDMICDTPPDYLFAAHDAQQGCNDWIIPVTDPCGNVVNPMENNTMSYFSNCGNYQFTPGQKMIIAADLLLNSDRNYVREGADPDTQPINEVPSLFSPQDNSTVNDPHTVALQWQPILSAEFYVVEVDTNPTFTSPLAQSKVVPFNVPTAIFQNLQCNAHYYWRVRAFSAYYTCTGFSDQWEFDTPDGTNCATSVNQPAFVKDFKVFPNPVLNQTSLIIELSSEENFSGDISLFSIKGKQIYRKPHLFTQNNNVVTIPINTLSEGIYILNIITDSGILTERVIVME